MLPSIYVTEDQIQAYREDLRTIRETKAKVVSASRKLKLWSILLSSAYLAIAFAATTSGAEGLKVKLFGTETMVSIEQLALAIPLLLGYLALLQVRMSVRKLRFEHEERILEEFHGLFGLPVSATITREMAKHCNHDEGRVPRRLYSMAKKTVDYYTGLIFLTAFLVGITSAISITRETSGSIRSDMLLIGFTTMLIASMFTGPIAFILARGDKNRALEELLNSPDAFSDLLKRYGFYPEPLELPDQEP